MSNSRTDPDSILFPAYPTAGCRSRLLVEPRRLVGVGPNAGADGGYASSNPIPLFPGVMTTTPEAIPAEGPERARQVRRLFSEIAPRYDLLNHVLSLNVDRSWRRKAVALLDWGRAPSGTYLDACTGTFDLGLELVRQPGFVGSVVASDFAAPMLVEGQPKLAGLPIRAVCGDSLRFPYGDAVFDGAMVGFGIRNLADLEGGLRELHRVLRPGARLVVLDFTTPPNALVRGLYLLYFHRVLPLLGRVVSGHPWAYSYLPESVRGFPGPEEFASVFERVGFQNPNWKLLSLGIAALHWGERSASAH